MKLWAKVLVGTAVTAIIGAMTGATVAQASSVTFPNCTALRAVHPGGVGKGHPAYRPELDRDSDGWACEVSGGDTPDGQESTSASPSPVVRKSSSSPSPKTSASRSSAPVGQEQLPVTGAGALLAGGAVTLLTIGGALVLVTRRRRVRFDT